LNSEIFYRDFWQMYAPGQFYLVALLFKIFGTHLLVELIAASIVCAAAASICYRLVFNLIGRKLAALVTGGYRFGGVVGELGRGSTRAL